MCVRACIHACVRECMHAYVRVYVHAYVCMCGWFIISFEFFKPASCNSDVLRFDDFSVFM